MRARKRRACSWAEADATGWQEQGRAFPPGKGAQRSGQREQQVSMELRQKVQVAPGKGTSHPCPPGLQAKCRALASTNKAGPPERTVA